MSTQDSMEEIIYKFEIFMSLVAPDIIDTDNIEENALYDDRAVVRYKLKHQFSIGEIIEKLEEVDRLIMLYYICQRKAVQTGRSCSFYSDSKRGQMFRIDFYTERDGKCHNLTVIFFKSLEYMYQDIIREHGRIQLHGIRIYLRPEKKVITDFM